MAQSAPAKVLIYTATKGFRHDSIPTAIAALKANQTSINVSFDNTEDPTAFNDHNLAAYDAVVFLSTTGEVLDDAGKTAFQKYLNLGGNFVGIHSASDSLVNTTFYTRELGANFDYHPPLQNATVDVLDNSHPSTTMLPPEWHVQDEMYNFKSDPRSVGATVLLAANESSYVDSGTRKYNQGTPHPLAWFQDRGAGVDDGNTAGRSFYTSLGHLNESWQDQTFLAHVLGGVQWALQSNTTRSVNPNGQVGNGATVTTGSTSNAVPSPSPSSPSSASNSGVSRLISAVSLALLVCLT